MLKTQINIYGFHVCPGSCHLYFCIAKRLQTDRRIPDDENSNGQYFVLYLKPGQQLHAQLQ